MREDEVVQLMLAVAVCISLHFTGVESESEWNLDTNICIKEKLTSEPIWTDASLKRTEGNFKFAYTDIHTM
jgi:hypothetical protein